MIAEPMTLITDLILGGLCAVLGTRLWRRARGTRSLAGRLLAAALATTAVAAVVGGTFHGFREVLGAAASTVLWKVTVWAIGATAFLFLAATLRAARELPGRDLLLTLGGMQLLVYCAWMIAHDDFFWVVLQYGSVMIVALAIQVRGWRQGEPGAGWIALGIVISFVGAAIQQAGIGLHESFNHNDVYHVVQMVGVWAFYRGGLEIAVTEGS